MINDDLTDILARAKEQQRENQAFVKTDKLKEITKIRKQKDSLYKANLFSKLVLKIAKNGSTSQNKK